MTARIQLDVPEIPLGESMTLSNINGEYILSEQQIETSDVDGYNLSFEQATIDFKRTENMLSKVLEVESSTFVTTAKELQNLAQNTQNNLDKIIKINGLVKYYINKDDLIGKVVETIENNVNTSFKLNYKNIPDQDMELKERIESLIEDFHNDIDIEQLIKENVVNTYTQGNYMTYLRGDSKNGYIIENYPLKIFKVSPYKIGNEPVLTLDIQELKSTLQKNQSEYNNLKSNKFVKIYKKVEDEIKATYPKEVADAVVVKDKIAFLDPTRTGLSRINNLRGLYGVSPIFKAIPSMLMVETFDEVDRINAVSRSKKIFHQVLRKELLGADGSKTKHPKEIGYAHSNFIQALGKSTVVVTTPAYVEEIKVLEPKSQETNPAVILSYRNRVLNALGISFMSNESKSSFNSVSVSVDEMLKTVNKISKQLEHILNKYYKIVLDDNGLDTDYAPTITIEDTRMIDLESKMKLVDLLYSKLGMSYRTVLEILGLDLDTEIMNRLSENKYATNDGVKDLDIDVFRPHSNSYTSNSNDLMQDNEEEEKPQVTDETNVDKNEENKSKYENQL
nr:MAG TPA: hypothetical protein [Caudoviricetes sp.]